MWERALPAKGKLGLPAGFQRPLESCRGFAPFAGEARSHRVRIWSALTANKKGVPFGTPFLFGGEGGIRTLDTRKRIHAFQACSFSHSDTSPKLIVTTSWPRSGSRTRACSLLGLTPSPLRGRHRYAATFACLRQGVSHSDTSPKLAALSHHQRARRVPEGRGSGKRGGVTQALSVLFLAR